MPIPLGNTGKNVSWRDRSAGCAPWKPLTQLTVALTTAALLVLQTRIKFKRDNKGKWSFEGEKKASGGGATQAAPFLASSGKSVGGLAHV